VPVEACSTRHIGEEGGGASRHAVLVGFLVGARALARRRGKYCSGGGLGIENLNRPPIRVYIGGLGRYRVP
jgi:hypothetical protein